MVSEDVKHSVYLLEEFMLDQYWGGAGGWHGVGAGDVLLR